MGKKSEQFAERKRQKAAHRAALKKTIMAGTGNVYCAPAPMRPKGGRPFVFDYMDPLHAIALAGTISRVRRHRAHDGVEGL